MRIVTLLDPEVRLHMIEHRLGPDLEWFDSYVIEALRTLGHDVHTVQHCADISETIRRLMAAKPQLVFNLTLHANGREEWCGHIPAVLDLLELPYTGAGPAGHSLSVNKAIAKRITRDAGMSIPRFITMPVDAGRFSKVDLRFPVLVKLLCSGGSTGLSQASLVTSHRALLSRVRWIHRRFGVDAICEEFIDGREVSVTLLGNKLLHALPVCEWTFRSTPRSTQFLTERIKWNSTHRRRTGVGYRRARLDKHVLRRVVDNAKKIYRLLELRDYGNIDLRISSCGEIYFLDGNANPGLRPVSREMGTMPFVEMIRRIVAAARNRARV